MKKRNTYPEDNPSHFAKHLKQYIRQKGLIIHDFESLRDIFSHYMDGSNMSSDKIYNNPEGIIAIMKNMPDDMVSGIMRQRGVARKEAEIIYNHEIRRIQGKVGEGVLPTETILPPKILLKKKFEIAQEQNKLVTGYIKGRKVKAYRINVITYVDRKGRIVKKKK